MIKITESFPKKEWETIHSFISDCYRADHALCYKKFFEWQFQVKPNDENVRIICGWDNSKLLGTHGYLPLAVHWGDPGQTIESVWTMYWMVRKQAPKGLGLLLAKKIQEMYPLVLSINASKIGSTFFKALGWSFFWRIPRYLCVFDKQQCIPMLCEGATEEDIDQFIFKSKISGVASISEFDLKKDNYCPQWRLYPNLAFSVVRSLEFLTWRYIDHPVFRYHIILKGQPHRPAVCVYRIEQAFGLHQAKVGRIVDFFYPGDNHGKEEASILMNSILKYMKDAGCAYVDFICSNKTYSQIFIDLGGNEEYATRQVLPVRLAPIERTMRHQNLVVCGNKRFFSPKLEDMYIAKSDIDGDCPARIPDAEVIKK